MRNLMCGGSTHSDGASGAELSAESQRRAQGASERGGCERCCSSVRVLRMRTREETERSSCMANVEFVLVLVWRDEGLVMRDSLA